jgi:hypothetical protein
VVNENEATHMSLNRQHTKTPQWEHPSMPMARNSGSEEKNVLLKLTEKLLPQQGPSCRRVVPALLGKTVRSNPGSELDEVPIRTNVYDESSETRATTRNDLMTGQILTLVVLFASSERISQGKFVCLCESCTYAAGMPQLA